MCGGGKGSDKIKEVVFGSSASAPTNKKYWMPGDPIIYSDGSSGKSSGGSSGIGGVVAKVPLSIMIGVPIEDGNISTSSGSKKKRGGPVGFKKGGATPDDINNLKREYYKTIFNEAVDSIPVGTRKEKELFALGAADAIAKHIDKRMLGTPEDQIEAMRTHLKYKDLPNFPINKDIPRRYMGGIYSFPVGFFPYKKPLPNTTDRYIFTDKGRVENPFYGVDERRLILDSYGNWGVMPKFRFNESGELVFEPNISGFGSSGGQRKYWMPGDPINYSGGEQAQQPATNAGGIGSVATKFSFNNMPGFEGVVAKPEDVLKGQKFAKGGKIRRKPIKSLAYFDRGLVASSVPGRHDALPKEVPPGGYVIPADVVSALGDGNTLSGAKILDEMFNTMPFDLPKGKPDYGMPYSGLMKSGGRTPVVLSGGEYLINPAAIVRRFGGLNKGHKILDKFVRKIRSKNINTLKNLPGPVMEGK